VASIRTQLTTRVITALQAATALGMTKPAGLTVRRMLNVPAEDSVLPLIIVFPSIDAREQHDQLREIHELQIVLDSRALVASGSSPDQAVDDLLTWAERALKADETLGGLAITVTAGAIEWDIDTSDLERSRALQLWIVLYLAQEFNPEAN